MGSAVSRGSRAPWAANIAVLQGESPAIAAALEEHYRRSGHRMFVPTEPLSIAVALADKLDTLVGFWAIDEEADGVERTPMRLRRAALAGDPDPVVENGGCGWGCLSLANAVVWRELREWDNQYNSVGACCCTTNT